MQIAMLPRILNRRAGRVSSWDITGRNADVWTIPAESSRVLADLTGPGIITHIWMTQARNYRNCLLKITYDNAPFPSVLCPLGDFFCLGHGIVNSFQSALFTASTSQDNTFETGCALNAYAPMPFRERAVVELINESTLPHGQYFYIDYETVPESDLDGMGYFHAEFRRTNPFGGWGPDLRVNTASVNVINTERDAWDGNFVILDTRGRGQYIGCNLSVANFQGTWWGEGDDMIWVDGYKWPPDLHGTGSEDYLNQAWGMQRNAFLRNGSSIHENDTKGYQTSYVFHLENPVRFQKEIKVTIEHGHGNHLGNEMSSVAYWYAQAPTRVADPPPVAKRAAVRRDNRGNWLFERANQCPGKKVRLNAERRQMRALYGGEVGGVCALPAGDLRRSPFVTCWMIAPLQAKDKDVTQAPCLRLKRDVGWRPFHAPQASAFVAVNTVFGHQDGIVYLANRFDAKQSGDLVMVVGHDGGIKVWVDGQEVFCEPARVNPAMPGRSRIPVRFKKGVREVVIALDTDRGLGQGIFFAFEAPDGSKTRFPQWVQP